MKRYFPLMLIVLLMVAAYLSGIGSWLSLEKLREHRLTLQEWVVANPLQAPLTFMAVYIAVVALSFPGAAILSLTGGFLFPQPLATVYVVVGATIGAVIVFLVAQTALGEVLRNRAGPRIRKMEEGFKKDAWSYLLFLRLVPAFPFWAVNLAPALFGVPLFTFVWTTLVGITPGAFVFTQAGAGLGAVLESGETVSFSAILNAEMRIALLALGLFALVPTIVRRIYARRQ